MNLAPAVRDFIFFSGSKGFILEDKKSIIINKNWNNYIVYYTFNHNINH